VTPGAAVLAGKIAALVVAVLAPPPIQSVSEWADAERVVPSYSANAGQWKTSLTPYLREIQDAFSTIGVNKVAFMKSARVGATEAGLNIIGYHMHREPTYCMIVLPTVDDAKEYSKEQLEPTIADTPALARLVSDEVKDKKNTILAKTYPGGRTVIGGANSPRFFRRRTSQVVSFEEIDGYSTTTTAKSEGDRIKLGEKRTESYDYRRKIYLNSTPTNLGSSRIHEEFLNGDQRHYHVPCPHCSHKQRLIWERIEYKGRDEPIYRCVSCEQEIHESHKAAMCQAGEWIAANPGAPHRSYHINSLYSPFVRWSRLVEEWIEAQSDPEKLQTFVNLVLGEPWEDRATKGVVESIQSRAVRYDGGAGDTPRAFDVPRRGVVLVCGVDKQPGELHYVVRAYGPDEESYLIEWGILRGDTSRPEVWGALDELRLTREWKHESGAKLKISAMAVDAGDDPAPVYAWTKPRLADSVFAIKGASDPTADILPKKYTKTSAKSRLYLIGVQAISRRLLRRAALPAPDPCPLEVGPTFMHFNERANATYLDEFFAMRPKAKRHRGKLLTVYERPAGKRNEKHDCEVYAYAALQLGPTPIAQLEAEYQKLMARAEQQATTDEEKAEPTAPVRPASSWVTGSRRRRGGWM
jgi:terminase, large subunit